MNIAILHHDLEPSEEKIKELIEKKGFKAFLFDVRESQIQDFKGIDLVLNRVYASVANRDYPSIKKTLKLLKELEKIVPCVNSYQTSLYDYNKYEAYKILKKNNIPTPKTKLIKLQKEINNFSEKAINELGMPIISKRNTGGRGKDISKINSKKELINDLKKKFKLAKKEKYCGGFIIQEFIKSSQPYDCRVALFNEKIISCIKRELISYNSKDKWLASTSKGSKMEKENPSKKIINLAIRTGKAMNATFNAIDFAISENGPVVIENNPTPNYIIKTDEENINLTKLIEEIINIKIK